VNKLVIVIGCSFIMSFTSITIDLKQDGKYHCPVTECSRAESNHNFQRLVKHCKTHSIHLLKNKVKTESTLRKERLMEERKAKKSRFLNSDDLLQMSVEEWQNSIKVQEEYVSKERLNEYGVLVVSNFLNCYEVDILNGCVKIAKLASKYETFQEREISGGIMTIDIPISHFSKEHMRFSSGTNVFQEITRKIRKMIGPEYSLVGDISILTTPNGAEKQFIHSDNIVKNRYNGLIVLSDTATPTLFLPKQYPDVAITQAPILNANGQIQDESERIRVRNKYSFMWNPVESLENKMRPLSSQPLKQGDLVLFEADMVHRGDACTNDKTLLFFHVRPTPSNYVEEDLQFHAGLLGSYIHGIIPSSYQDKNAYYGMIRSHNLHHTNAKVPLTELIGPKVKKSYENWLYKQPTTPGI
jgi:hypothetical protein